MDEQPQHTNKPEDVAALLSATKPVAGEQFRLQLEERLLSRLQAGRPHAAQAAREQKSAAADLHAHSLPKRAAVSSRVPTFGVGFGSRVGRAASMAMGVVGVALLALLFVGMSALLQSRQQAGGGPSQPWVTPTPAAANELSNEAFAASLVPITTTQEQLATGDSIAWSPDGRSPALAILGPRSLRFWYPENPGAPGAAVDWEISGGTHTGIAWSPDGQLIAVRSEVGSGGQITLFGTSDLRQTNSHSLTKPATEMAWSPDGQTLAYSDGDVFTLWKTGGEVPYNHWVPAAIAEVRSDGAKITAVAWSETGRLAVSRGSEIIIWDPNSDDHKAATLENDGTVTKLAWAYGGGYLAAAVESGPGRSPLELWGASNDWKLNEWVRVDGPEVVLSGVERITSLTWSRFLTVGVDRTDVAVGRPYRSGRVELYVLDRTVKSPLSTFPGAATDLAWSPDGWMLAVAEAGEGKLTVWGRPTIEPAAATITTIDITPAPTVALPNEATLTAIASMTVVPVPTQVPGLQATLAARATTSPYPTAGTPTVEVGRPSIATARRGHLVMEVQLDDNNYLAGENGRALIALRNEGQEALYVYGRGLTLADEAGQEYRSPWPVQAWSGPLGHFELAPGKTATDALTFQVPGFDETTGRAFHLTASVQFGRFWSDLRGNDGVPLDLQAGPLPLQVIEPEPRQRLKADLQLDRQGWTLRVTDGEGRAPAGPFWGGWEAQYNMGATSSLLPEPSQAGGGTEPPTWSVPWHEGPAEIIRGGSEVAMHLWVAARGYVSAVVTGTLPSALPTGVTGAVDTPTPIRSLPPVPTVPASSSGAPTPTMAADFAALARGYWEAKPRGAPYKVELGGIAFRPWYAIDFTAEGAATVTWDNGLACTTSPAAVSGNTILVTAGDIEAEFTIHGIDATWVDFRQGRQRDTLKLQKTRDDPRVVCY